MPLTCKICTRELKSTRIYCSLVCQHIGQRKRIIIYCKNCKKSMEVRPSKKHKFCSNKCQLIYQKVIIPLRCKKCKKIFEVTPGQKNRIFCSLQCIRKPVVLKCQICKKKFRIRPARKEEAKYCSHRCYALSLKGNPPLWSKNKEKRKLVGKKISFTARKNYAAGTRLPYWKGKKRSTESIKKTADAQRGRKLSLLRKKRISLTVKNLWKNKTYAGHMSEAHLGNIPVNKGIKGAEYKEKFLKGEDPPGTIKLSAKKIRRIISLYTQKKFSIAKIAEKMSINPNKIHNVLKEQSVRRITHTENVLRQLEKGVFPRSGTKIEVSMIKAFQRRGYKLNMDFFHQYNLRNKFSLDLAFPKVKLGIECDGDYWHAHPEKYDQQKLNNTQKRNIRYDKARKAYTAKVGWKLLHFWESDIKKDVDKCVSVVEKFLKNQKER